MGKPFMLVICVDSIVQIQYWAVKLGELPFAVVAGPMNAFICSLHFLQTDEVSKNLSIHSPNKLP